MLGPVEVVGDGLEDAEEDDVDGARLLQVHEPGEHLPRMEPVGAAQILLAAAVGEGLRLLAGPGEAQPAGGCDRVDEEGLVGAEPPRIAEPIADRGIVCAE